MQGRWQFPFPTPRGASPPSFCEYEPFGEAGVGAGALDDLDGPFADAVEAAPELGAGVAIVGEDVAQPAPQDRAAGGDLSEQAVAIRHLVGLVLRLERSKLGIRKRHT
jgi:hypothetical protein